MDFKFSCLGREVIGTLNQIFPSIIVTTYWIVISFRAHINARQTSISVTRANPMMTCCGPKILLLGSILNDVLP